MNEFEIGDRVSYPGYKSDGIIKGRDDKFYAIDWNNGRINMYPNNDDKGISPLYLVNTAAWQDFQEKISDRI